MPVSSRIEADIVVRAPDQRPIVVVEVKNREDLSPAIATAFRRNLLAHGLLTSAPYFLLVSQDVGYLWNRSEDLAMDAPPMRRFRMEGIVDRYLPGLGRSIRLRGPELELIVFQWLSDLAEGRFEPRDEPEQSLDGSGLLEALQGAQVTTAVGV